MKSDLKDDILRKLKNPGAWAIAVGKLGILLVRESLQLRAGTITPAEFRVRAGGHFGSSAGIVLGAATGAALGVIAPGIGNVAGAFAGGIIGSMAGEEFGRATAGLMAPDVDPKKDAPPK